VLKGLILGPILFNLFINDLDEAVEFADDIKLRGGYKTDTPDRCAAMQKDCAKLENWTERNLMKFNKEKCKVLPVNNAIRQYVLGAGWVASSFAENVPGVLVVTKLTMNHQRRPLQSGLYYEEHWQQIKGGDTFTPLRPDDTHLECCAQFQAPQRHKDLLE